MDIKIRVATPEDADAVARIASECWTDIYNGFKEQMGEDIYRDVYPTDPIFEKGERMRSVVLEGRVFVAESNGEICGFSSYYFENPTLGSLKDNAVSAKYKGHGIAAMLYEAVFEKLRSLGCKTVRVGTGLDEAHAPARRAYEKAGFVTRVESVSYYKKL